MLVVGWGLVAPMSSIADSMELPIISASDLLLFSLGAPSDSISMVVTSGVVGEATPPRPRLLVQNPYGVLGGTKTPSEIKEVGSQIRAGGSDLGLLGIAHGHGA